MLISTIRSRGRKTLYYHCSACNVTNMLDSDDTNKHGLSNLIHHRQADLHCYNVQSLAGRKGTENTVVMKIFAEIEKTVGKNIFILAEGFVTCRCCKGIKITLFGKGSFMTRIKDHVNGKDHKSNNMAQFERMKSISSFFPPAKKKVKEN